MDIIFCAGGNKRFAEIAISLGFKYGVRHDKIPYWQPFMVDINWKSYDWSEYVEKIKAWQPVMAMVPDYEFSEQWESMITRAHELRRLDVERVMVCPKFDRAVADIPDWCIVAISVPTSYAGYLPRPSELRGRKVHLLGGAPQDQFKLVRYYHQWDAEVVSIDVNMHMKAAQRGTFFDGRVWRNLGAGVLSTDEAFTRSCRAILRTA